MDDPKQLTGLIVSGAIVLHGLDSAILGHTEDGILVYGDQRILAFLKSKGLSEEGAHEWMQYNVLHLQAQEKGFVLCYELP